MLNSKIRMTALMAVAALAAASAPALSNAPRAQGKRRPQVKTYYGGMTAEQQAWNDAIEAKRKARKGLAAIQSKDKHD